MQIHIATGTGTGTTTLGAFDSALNNIGIANYNLIYLSSVIPPDSDLVLHNKKIPAGTLPGNWGDRLYIVMAQKRVVVPNTEAWVGIGWVQDPVTKKGLFVEHEAESEEAVRADIKATLHDLMKTRGIDFGEVQMVVTGATCKSKPVCAMAVAVYQASDWENKAQLIGA